MKKVLFLSLTVFCFGFTDIKQVNEQLLADGFLTSRAVKQDGEVVVHKGTVGHVTLDDPSTSLLSLKRKLFGINLENRVFNIKELDSIVSLYNKLPSNKVKVSVTPGDKPYTSDIYIFNDYIPTYTLGASANYAKKSDVKQDRFDRQTYALFGSFQQILGLNDILGWNFTFNRYRRNVIATYNLMNLGFSYSYNLTKKTLHNDKLNKDLLYKVLDRRLAVSYNDSFKFDNHSILSVNYNLERKRYQTTFVDATLNNQVFWNNTLGVSYLYPMISGYNYLVLGLSSSAKLGHFTQLNVHDNARHTKFLSYTIGGNLYSRYDDFGVQVFKTKNLSHNGVLSDDYRYEDDQYGYKTFDATILNNRFKYTMNRGDLAISPFFEVSAAFGKLSPDNTVKRMSGVGTGVGLVYHGLSLQGQFNVNNKHRTYLGLTLSLSTNGGR